MARTIRPGPVRTGRELDDRLREDVLLRFDEVRRVWLPDDRDRELLPLDLLEPRDLGGEDVRVAMIARLCRYHTSLTRHTPIFRPVSPIRPRRDGCTESSHGWERPRRIAASDAGRGSASLPYAWCNSGVPGA